ncbi:gas vesicle protein [Candidatus Thiosymbion oneisti]|uniref:gas vesicle protein n=1 Tax=Candidatus Thiosymbion oneisti TaxID=589554 RepID=UPI000B7DEB21|nr:gas vesicle protein [Candidatus Thiosymbion oneisti]
MARHPHMDQEQIALSEMLDRILNKGAVIMGEATISVADVDLIYLSLRVLVSSIDKALRGTETYPEESP